MTYKNNLEDQKLPQKSDKRLYLDNRFMNKLVKEKKIGMGKELNKFTTSLYPCHFLLPFPFES